MEGEIQLWGTFRHGMDLVYSWPTGEFAIMGAEQAAALLYRKEIAQVEDPEIIFGR